MIRFFLSLSVLAAFGFSAAAGAAEDARDNGIFVAAGQVGGQGSQYAIAGVIAPLPGSKFGQGWVMRVFAEEIGYRYKVGARRIDGTALGGSAAFGYQHAYSSGWLGAYGGIAYHHTHLSPDDPASRARGGQTAARFQAEGEHHVTGDMKLNVNTTVDASDNTAFWARLRALYRVSGDIYAGPEGVYQGDKDYKSWQTGVAVLGLPVTPHSSLGFGAGVRKTERVPAAGYVGVEFGVNF